MDSIIKFRTVIETVYLFLFKHRMLTFSPWVSLKNIGRRVVKFQVAFQALLAESLSQAWRWPALCACVCVCVCVYVCVHAHMYVHMWQSVPVEVRERWWESLLLFLLVSPRGRTLVTRHGSRYTLTHWAILLTHYLVINHRKEYIRVWGKTFERIKSLNTYPGQQTFLFLVLKIMEWFPCFSKERWCAFLKWWWDAP